MVSFEIEGSIFPDNPLEDKFLCCSMNSYIRYHLSFIKL